MRHVFFSVLVALALGLAGAGDALAKAGTTSKSSGGSFGSRGDRTLDRPIERTLTPPPAGSSRPTNTVPPVPQSVPRGGNVDSQPLAPQMAPGGLAGAAMAPQSPPGFFQRNPFMAGMAGGLVGAGIGSMLFGHSPAMASASDMSPVGSMFGLFLQVLVIGGLIWLGIRLFRGGSRAELANPYARASQGHIEPVATLRLASPRVEKEFEPNPADQQAFTEILQGVQSCWSNADLQGLRRWATPEVVSWLAEDMNRNASEGLVNKVENVALLKGGVTESWSERGFDYVTAVLTFQCVDYMVRADTGAVAQGSLTTPVTHNEAWTFVRAAGGQGRWLLSAVEQVQ